MPPGPMWFSYRQFDGAHAYEGAPRDARVTRHDQTDRHVPGQAATLGDMSAESTGTAGRACHYVFMADALGVDLNAKDDSAPFVITGPLPESVERNVEFVRQRRVRDEWRSRVKRGEITRTPSATPPPGLSAWFEWQLPLVVGGGVGLGLLVVVSLLAAALGHLFGFHPGSVGIWVGVLGGLAVGLAVQLRQDHARDRDMKLLVANQRKITDPWDQRQMIEAHQAAKAVMDVWPHLPLDEGDVIPRLRTALWQLANVLPERQQLHDTLTELSRATWGVPANDPAAAELAVRIAHAKALHQAKDDEVRQRIEHLKALASRCQRFHDERRAIHRARQVSRQADSVLRTFGSSGQTTGATGQQPAGDMGAFTQHIAAVLDAYRKLGHDVGGGNS